MKVEFHFWFLFLYFCVILFHLLGFDQKHVLLDLTSPLRWYELAQRGVGFSTFGIYVYDLLIWYVFGWLIDGLILLIGRGKRS
ncbi:formate/nitrite transporter FocA (FNT family) [Croceifilum oryzae]|uniref:Formate/nitrite transporter FocA (FNT family) n=1 Tax=Croceifilum oryzae TaxID=1553429 RepID=A0AAJ1WRX3_9BACL|nr:hypothetical protein [Croceifilum oryzae]MDQ0416443.1 formate/nitrite transporter FocA (FNT family) [Croceifilum oryzae]